MMMHSVKKMRRRIPTDMKEKAEEYRAAMVEAVAELDDELMMKYLEGEDAVDQNETSLFCVKLPIAVYNDPVVLRFCLQNKGVQKLLDAIHEYMPAPTDIPAIKGVNPETGEEDERPSDDQPFSALAFKIMTDPFVGKLCILPCVLRYHELPVLTYITPPKIKGAYRTYPADARQPP